MNDQSILKVWAGLSVVIILLLAAMCGYLMTDTPPESSDEAQGGPPAMPPTLVVADPVRVETVQQKRLIIGQLEPVQQSVVAAEEQGLVLQGPPDVGTAVAKGDILVRMDTVLVDQERAVARSQIDVAVAQLNQYQATLEQATALRKRYESLIDEGAITQVEFDQAVRDEQVAQAQMANAQASIESRRAELISIDIQLEKMVIHAPFDGRIIEKQTEAGQWLSPGAAVVTLVGLDPIDAVLDVPESVVPHLDTESPVQVFVPALDLALEGKIHRTVPNADRLARTFDVLVRLNNADQRLAPGMSVRAELPTGQAVEAITVHRDAVKTTTQGFQVFAVRGGVAVPVGVVIHFMVGDRMVVDAPLSANDRVVTEGNERLFPGQMLQVMGDPPPEQPGPPTDAPAEASKP